MTVTNSQRLIETEAQLRELIPWPGKPVKKIDTLERQSRNFISHAPFLVTTMQRPDNLIEVRAYGGQPGFVQVLEDHTFLIPTRPGQTAVKDEGFAGCLFLIPGVNETLRVNGRIKFASDAPVDAQSEASPNALAVEEVFMHCAKALIRSKLWKTEDLAGQPNPLGEALPKAESHTSDRLDEPSRAFIEKSPFICLGTNLPGSGSDIAPRGDPAGFVKILDDRTLLIPERRGNNLADNLTNMIANPWAGVLFLVPGVEAELWVSGGARVTTEPALLEMLTEQNKTPLVGIVLSIKEVELRPSSALSASRLWQPETKIDRKSFPTLGEIFRDQLDNRGLPKEVTAEEIDTSLAKDSVKNLY
jgi:PPOX class probable FMN-dependent enzyme